MSILRPRGDQGIRINLEPSFHIPKQITQNIKDEGKIHQKVIDEGFKCTIFFHHVAF